VSDESERFGLCSPLAPTSKRSQDPIEHGIEIFRDVFGENTEHEVAALLKQLVLASIATIRDWVRQMVPPDDVVSDGEEPTVEAFGALDPRLLANASHPFVGTCGCVPGPARLAAFEPSRVHILSTSEERPE